MKRKRFPPAPADSPYLQPLKDIVADYPRPDHTQWVPEPSTISFLRRFAQCSGVYLLRHHRAYHQSVRDVFKYGRCDQLDRRFHDYKGVMTIVGFFQTPFPRATEWLVRQAVRGFVIHGTETVCLPLHVLIEVCSTSQQMVLRGRPPQSLVQKHEDRALLEKRKKSFLGSAIQAMINRDECSARQADDTLHTGNQL